LDNEAAVEIREGDEDFGQKGSKDGNQGEHAPVVVTPAKELKRRQYVSDNVRKEQGHLGDKEDHQYLDVFKHRMVKDPLQ